MLINDKIIFTFWEPDGKIPSYLALCLETWKLNLPEYKIVVLNYQNISNYLNRNIIALSTLKKFSLPMQKDIIQIAILQKYGGIFMDIDTLVLKDISSIINKLKDTELIMFDGHMAFMAARPNGYILNSWLNRIQEKIKQIDKKEHKNKELPWDYIGNSILAEIKREIIFKFCLIKLLPRKTIQNYMQKISTMPGKKTSDKIKNLFKRVGRHLLFITIYRRYLLALNRIKSHYILELSYFRNNSMGVIDKYCKFWFEDQLEIDKILKNNPMIIALHNSWTPEWYKELSVDSVLQYNCLLSKLLDNILQDTYK